MKQYNNLSQKTSNITTRGFNFKIFFMVLVSVTSIVSFSLYMSNISLDHSTKLLRNFTKHIHSYYMWTDVKNETLLSLTSLPNRSQWISNATEVTRQDISHVTRAEVLHHHNAHPHNYHYILDEPDKCEKLTPFLTLMVPVAPQQVQARDAIRRTWGNESVVQGKVVTVLFIVGLPQGGEAEKLQEYLQLESKQHRDLIQSNFMDTYSNLTIKTLVIMDWLSTHCTQATYAMKIDSDMFLNVENLISMLLAPNTPRQNYITGMIMWNRPVVRNTLSKWYVSKESYEDEYYPTYLLGMGYIFSSDLPEKIVTISKDIKPFNIEDAYIGVCLKQLGISPSKLPDASQFRAYFNGNYQRSDFARVITTILYSPEQLVTFWQDLKNPTLQ